MSKSIFVPDIGTDEAVELIEICVAVGDRFEAEDELIILESDKASMEIPAPFAGVVKSISVNVGDELKTGDLILEADVGGEVEAQDETPEAVPASSEEAPKVAETSEPEPEASSATAIEKVITVHVPDIGTDDAVELIEISVRVGDEVAQEDSLITLESDKASMEIPSPHAGVVASINVEVGQSLKTGDAILELKIVEQGASNTQAKAAEQPVSQTVSQPVPANTAAPVKSQPPAVASTGIRESKPSQQVYAGPAVRLLARELGVDLAQVTGSGPKGRVIKDDVQQYVKAKLQQVDAAIPQGSAIPPIPEVDFSEFGEVRIEPMTKLHKLTASNMQRNWLNVPHVTQFDELDVTDLEAFRKEQKAAAEKRGVKLTPLAFIFKALAAALKASPKFNASLYHDGEHIVYKEYVHIGMAVDTPQGLVVPVIRDVDKKNIWELAEEISEVAAKARDRKLRPNDMKGACFTVSSLGGIGGTGFTPIINAPEVAILGISRMQIKPVWNAEEETFAPHKMLPVSLSYDHRALNGGDAGRFLTLFSELISDLRQLALLG